MLTLTDNAVKRFKDLIGVKKIKNHGVRIFTSGGG
jgi:Fe-S cluster assembly iron-binding protein IscA